MQPLIIDCSQLCYAAHFTSGHLSYEEKQTGVIFGFLHQVFKLAQSFETNKFAFCWDSKKSYRKEICPEYKANRGQEELTEEEIADRRLLYSQIAELRMEVIPALGFKNNFIRTGLEADDIIAKIVLNNSACTVVSSDNDLWQLLGHCAIYDLKNKVRFDAKDLFDRHGVTPLQWGAAKVIAGCVGDNVAGVKGVGMITAIKYVKGELKGQKAEDIGLDESKRLKDIKSDEGQKIAERNMELIVLPFQDMEISLDFKEDFDFDSWVNLFNRYGFKSFLKKEYFSKLKEIFELPF